MHEIMSKGLTCRFDDVIRSGSGNLSTVLVHTPAVTGISETLDWASEQIPTEVFVMKTNTGAVSG